MRRWYIHDNGKCVNKTFVFRSLDCLGTRINDKHKPSLLAVVRVDSFAITFSNILAPNITAWCEIFVVFDYLEYILAKSSNRPLSFFIIFPSVLLAVSQFSLQQQTGEYVITIPLKGLALFSTLYPGGTEDYCYTHFQNSQVFALSGGVSLKILIQSDHCHAGRVFIYT